MIQQELDSLFKSVMMNPLEQSIWNQIDLMLLDLKFNDYKVILRLKDFSCPHQVVNFNKKMQHNFIKNEIKRLLYLELHNPIQCLLSYKKDVLSKWWKLKRKIRVYDDNYIIVKGNTIIINLCNNELINLKLKAMVSRRLGSVVKIV